MNRKEPKTAQNQALPSEMTVLISSAQEKDEVYERSVLPFDKAF